MLVNIIYLKKIQDVLMLYRNLYYYLIDPTIPVHMKLDDFILSMKGNDSSLYLSEENITLLLKLYETKRNINYCSYFIWKIP